MSRLIYNLAEQKSVSGLSEASVVGGGFGDLKVKDAQVGDEFVFEFDGVFSDFGQNTPLRTFRLREKTIGEVLAVIEVPDMGENDFHGRFSVGVKSAGMEGVLMTSGYVMTPLDGAGMTMRQADTYDTEIDTTRELEFDLTVQNGHASAETIVKKLTAVWHQAE